MALTDTAIRNAKPKEKPYKVTDAQGLYLLVNPTRVYIVADNDGPGHDAVPKIARALAA